MASLTWKRKKSLQTSASVFNNDNEDGTEDKFVYDWRSLIPSNKKAMLEDYISKGNRLLEEATVLADEERYWEATTKFDEALQFIPTNAKIHEMKAQALLEVGELFPAIQAAESAIKHNPTWAEAYQTLGRAQIGIGEIKLALKSFSKAYHLKPDLEDLLDEDICWAKELLVKQNNIEKEEEKSKQSEYECVKEHCCRCGKQTKPSVVSTLEKPLEIQTENDGT